MSIDSQEETNLGTNEEKKKPVGRWAAIPAEFKATILITPLLFGLAFLLGFMQIANTPSPMPRGPTAEATNGVTDSITPSGAPASSPSRSRNRPTYVVYASSPTKLRLVRVKAVAPRPQSAPVTDYSPQPSSPDHPDGDGKTNESGTNKHSEKNAAKAEKTRQKEAAKAAKAEEKCQNHPANNSHKHSQKPPKHSC